MYQTRNVSDLVLYEMILLQNSSTEYMIYFVPEFFKDIQEAQKGQNIL